MIILLALLIIVVGVAVVYASSGKESPPPAVQQPDTSYLTMWRRTPMPTVTKIPPAALYHGAVVTDGQLIDFNNGRQVKVIHGVPDDQGQLLVQENFKVAPEAVGCTYQPPKVVVEYTLEEATALMKFLKDNNYPQSFNV